MFQGIKETVSMFIKGLAPGGLYLLQPAWLIIVSLISPETTKGGGEDAILLNSEKEVIPA